MNADMTYDAMGAVFWDAIAGYRRWNQIRFDGKPADTMYQAIPLTSSPLHWFKAPISFAVVDDFGNLVRVQ